MLPKTSIIENKIEKVAENKLITNKIKDLEKEKRATLNNYKFNLYNFLDNFNILTVTMGTIIAFSTNTVIQELTRDTLVPIIMNLINISDTFTFFGVKLNSERIVGNFIYMFLILIIFIILFRFVFSNYTTKMIKDRELSKVIDKEIKYKELEYLEKIDKKLSNLNNSNNKNISNLLN